jgi:translation initiation factor 5B
MKKLGLTREQVEEEASKFGITVAECHFVEASASAKASDSKKGRPKKEKMVVEVEGATTDLFASLVAEAASDSESDDESVAVVVKKSSAKALKKEEEKAAAKAAKEAEKAAALKKKEEEKAAAALKKEEEKAAAKAAKEAEKESLKKVVAVEEPVQEEDVCEKINDAGQTKKEFLAVNPEGKYETKYLRSKNFGVVYDKASSEAVGIWNAEKGKIEFNTEFVESENEEEEEEDNEEEEEEDYE